MEELELKENSYNRGYYPQLFSNFKSFVDKKNVPEITKFIQHYVDKVVVQEEHVDFILNWILCAHKMKLRGSIEMSI
ncbi:hypothetical protein A8709_09285 [Paenibacillus pectinilyticus]|uniref:Uncharacterized protein n=1 Tax=Paenibacillus pectinilyticus TaxID=512399 RepID=A0A1C1A5H1_9BACL|nr:hypothetical protein A8709_09285 [Paenibacillus pectinilyticus]